VEDDDVDNDRPEDCEPERNEPADEQKDSADHLTSGNYVNVTARKEHMDELTDEALRQRRHRQKPQKSVRAEKDKNQTKQQSNNHRKDFHRPFMSEDNESGKRKSSEAAEPQATGSLIDSFLICQAIQGPYRRVKQRRNEGY
jgi:hypothetical protein